jgi:exopolysaccharide biosynthesis WecB/TagA/CpsF family protein
MAMAEKIKIGVLLWKKGLSEKADVEKVLREKYPTLEFYVETLEREVGTPVSPEFLNFQPKIVFVAFGFPYQEKFIFHNLVKVPSAKVVMGVGGTFDFLTGRRKRAPKFFRAIGLEWSWRLLIDPRRVNRIFNAVVVFSAKVFKSKFICPLFYRPNVVCLLYKKEGDRYKILIVKRRDDSSHWQLPQGGTDDESLLIAGAREAREELNTDKFIAKRVYKNVYRYRFGDWHSKVNSDENLSRRIKYNYKGQAQGLFIGEFTGKDEDIKINYWDHSQWKWVDSEKLVDEVHLVRKRAAERFLKRFKEFVKLK